MNIRKVLFIAVTNLLCLSYGSSESNEDVKDLLTHFPKCGHKNKYRKFDGSSTNVKYPSRSKANTPFGRLLPPNYANKKTCEPPVAKNGKPLPNARKLSLTFFPDKEIKDPIWTLMFMQFGQFFSHDLSLASGTAGVKCCTRDGRPTEDAKTSKVCFNIDVDENDPMRREHENKTCLGFVRTKADSQCEQLNAVTHSLDLSQIYGKSIEDNKRLREGEGGRLREGKGHNLPTAPEGTCDKNCPVKHCLMAGDVRVNQNPQLTILQTLYLREHNRVAEVFSKLNPHWNDETIFQEARRFLIAAYQHVSYYEWITILLGEDHSFKNKVVYDTTGYVNDFEGVKGVIYNEYATAASRVLHSVVAGKLEKMDDHRSITGSIRLKDNFACPTAVLEEKNFCELTTGLVTQQQLKNDENHVEDITQYLFGNTDLKAVDIQRGRDHGLATYNDAREFCGLSKAKSFKDFEDQIPNKFIELLSKTYESPNDVDMILGMQLENSVSGTFIGHTTRCIMTKQFNTIRKGDMLWYEHKCAGFSLEQLREIRKASIARLVCDNACHRNMSIQAKAFEKVHSDNKITLCSNLPEPDLSKWKDGGKLSWKQVF